MSSVPQCGVRSGVGADESWHRQTPSAILGRLRDRSFLGIVRFKAKLVLSSAVLWTAVGSAPAQAEGPLTAITLQDAYQRALDRSEDTGIAQQNIEQAEVTRRATWVAIAPQASITGFGLVQNRAPFVQSPQLQAEGRVLQPIFRRGFFASREAAHFGVEAATLFLERARQQVMLDVTTAFVAVLRSRQAVLVADAAVQRAEAQVSSATARVQAGGALRTAQLQATISFRQAQVDRVRIGQDLKIQELEFERLVGIGPPATLSLPVTPALPGLAEAVASSLERKDLRALQQQASAARALEQSLGGLRWPRLDLLFRYDQAYPRNPPIPPSSEGLPLTVQGIAQLTLPLFQGGDEFFRVEAQRVIAEVALLRTHQLVKQIAEQLRSALSELETAKRSFALAELQIKDAQENYALVTTQFKLRTVTFLEVATAQSALTNAENLLLISNFDRELAAYRLLFAIGTLQL